MQTLKEMIVGVQMLFVAFGALVLVPILTGLNPAIALLSAGIGTLIFQFLTGRQVPIFLGSSFAFIAPIILAIQTWGLAATQGAIMATALVYLAFAFLIKKLGTGFIHRVFPPIVIAPVIIVIGLSLAPTAVNMAMGLTGDGSAVLVEKPKALLIAFVSLGVTVMVALYGKGLNKLLAVLAGIVAGYFLSIIMGLTNFAPIQEAQWFAVPQFTAPSFQLEAILFFIPVALAPAIEHIGDVAVISQVCNRPFLEKPGLHRTMAGDGIAVGIAGFLGGPPVTTYSEVTGAVSITGAKNANIMIFASISAIILAFVGKLSAFLSTMPTPIMGGIMILLFGSISAMGARTLLDENADIKNERSVIIIAITLVVGLGHLSLELGKIRLEGIGLSALVAIFLNLVLPKKIK